jgi:hypothetical protein
VFVAARAPAIAAQCILPPSRRTRIIFVAAAIPSTLLIDVAFISVPLAPADLGWFPIAATLVFAFLTFMFVGITGAIVGSELASLTRWLLRRHD